MNARIIAALFSFVLIAAAHAQTVFTLNKTNFTPGESITATWSGRSSPKAKDWIGIYPRNVAPGAVNSTIWCYTSGTGTAGAAKAEGSVTFTNPTLAMGQWTAFFLDNDGYGNLGSVDFVVAPAPTAVAFSLNKTSYPTGEAITATWSNRTPASANDRVGIFPRNANPASTAATLWVHTSGTQTPGSALAAGSVTFGTPGLAIGNWTAHFLDADGTTSLANFNFSITAPLPAFTLDKPVYQLGESIKVTWSGRTGPSATDWVGIYPSSMSGVPDGSPASTIWAYMGGTQTAGTPLAEGTFTFTNPGLPKGNWTAYFLANDGYQILGTVQFTVANSPRITGFTADHSFINEGNPITLSWVIDPGDGVVESLVLGDGSTQTNVSGLDVLEVSPEHNSTYTLTLNGNVTLRTQVFKETGNSEAFSINGSHLSSGSPLTAVWNGATGNPDSWIAIYRAGEKPGTNYAAYWQYLNGSQTTGGNFPAGSMSFNPATGEYYAVLFTNGGYAIEQGPIRFTVLPGQAKPLEVTRFSQDGEDMRLDWNSLPGLSYDVETSTDLLQWHNEAENVRASGTSSSLFMPATPGDSSRFYRVKRR
ncbi:hypothetical protein JIN84_11315 [Luteolibacter yonseiensis]|uniref:Uncharacterized protein n=1 Tax=Luteolibacter yonseiensis TaxID=1144680 RepID=A0A934V7J3_9BACT|nr:hypothetical protein [Luteolibacter yonseiensis]MBK1816202.1 hypothetical protein [Luteolibacter yonseiensis]